MTHKKTYFSLILVVFFVFAACSEQEQIDPDQTGIITFGQMSFEQQKRVFGADKTVADLNKLSSLDGDKLLEQVKVYAEILYKKYGEEDLNFFLDRLKAERATFRAQRSSIPTEEGNCELLPNGDLDWTECDLFETATVYLMGLTCEHYSGDEFLNCCQELICTIC